MSSRPPFFRSQRYARRVSSWASYQATPRIDRLRLKARGSLHVVSESASRRRQTERADSQDRQRTSSSRTIARLMTIGPDLLTKAEKTRSRRSKLVLPTLVEAHDTIA